MQFAKGLILALLLSSHAVAQSQAIEMTPSQAEAITNAIQGAGFNCPLAKLSFAEGEDAFGSVARVFCGPRGQDGVFENAVFRFTFRPNGEVLVSPWANR